MITGARVRAAEARDDAAIRRLLRDHPLPGDVRVILARDPDFFAGTAVEGRRVQVGVAEVAEVTKDAEVAGATGAAKAEGSARSGADAPARLAGLVVRAEKDAYLNGVRTPLGYLGGWRLGSGARGLAALRAGAALVRRWHAEGAARLYLLGTAGDAARSASLLASGRLGLPVPRDFGGLTTYLLRPAAGDRLRALPDLAVTPARESDLPEVAALLARGSARQFFPAYTLEDLRGETGLLRGLAPGDILLARRGDSLAGCLALWDQSAFRQQVVAGYRPWLARLRPAVNLWHRARSLPLLPPAGGTVPLVHLSLVCIPGEDADVFAALLKAALRSLRGGPSHAAVLLHDRDPFRAVLRGLPAYAWRSRLHVACYPDADDGAGAAACAELDDRVPYLEPGSL